MKVKILEKDSYFGLESAVNDWLSDSYNAKYKEVVNIKYSSHSTRFRGDYYSAMIIYKDK